MKKLYRKMINVALKINILLYIFKTWIFEWKAILKKKSLYKNVKFSKEQKIEINNFWKQEYGKKVSLRWHKLYQSINSTYCKEYFPDYIFSTKLEPKLNPINIAKFYSDKGLLEIIYSSVSGVRFPETIILNSSGFFYDRNRNIVSANDAINIILKNDCFVIKPTLGGSSGHGVKIFNVREHSINDIENILNNYKKNYIVQKKVKPNQIFKNLYPYAINTVRIITYIVGNEIHIAPLSLRMGANKNNVDNIHSGGLVVGVTDDGYLNKFAYKLGYLNSKEKFEEHPDSGISFLNYKLPKITEMKNIAKELHKRTPHLGIISWDLTVDIDDNVVLIEGNYFGQSIWFPQIVHGKSIFTEDTLYFMNKIKK